MEIAFRNIMILGFLILGNYSCDNPRKEKTDNLIVITNTSLIDMNNGQVSEGMTLIIKNGIITTIGKSNEIELSPEAKIVNGTGKYIIPGLWDMHAHTSSESVTRSILYPLFIANGVTGIRVLSADCFEPCWELDMSIEQSRGLQSEVKYGKVIGPNAILGSTYIHGVKSGEASTIKEPGNRQDGKKLVHLLLDRGVDFIKIYDEIPREAYFGIADEANKKELPIAGHVPASIKASEASDAGQKSIEHCCAGSLFEECSSEEKRLREQITELIQSREPKNMYSLVLELVKTYDDAKCQEVFKKFLENNTFFTPTLVATEMDNILRDYDWRDDSRLKYLPEKEHDFWIEDEISTKEILGIQNPLIREKRFNIVGDMNKAGVKLLAGSDCGVFGVHYGFGLHEELELLVEAGLTELEALQTATLNAAEYADKSDSYGNIKIGFIADLILLEANPLDNISNTKEIYSVLSNGKFYDRQSLDTILKKVAIEVAK
ncbi:amidohydrolase family protein [Maribacter arenosus]|uniref:Amidohydrolase family protein n=1 Tax=Maribacter arenosus TaxID=1854708 RepID=A0ABR7VG00_9FLAO|nr:amidohydrolase family protein [Maribacter arenosus]MBD0852566.1 amidohydrolase family protein [Maribacter arenosus]